MSINKLDDKWKKDFKNKLGDYRHPVRENMWDDITNSLPVTKKRSRRIVWAWLGSTAAMLTAVIVLAGPRIIHSVLEMEIFDRKIEKTSKNNKGKKLHNNEKLDIESEDVEVINATDSIDYESINIIYTSNEEEGREKTNTSNQEQKSRAIYNPDSKNRNMNTTNEKGMTNKIKEEENIYNQKQNENIKNENLQLEDDFNTKNLNTGDPAIDDIILSIDTLAETNIINEVQKKEKRAKTKKDYSSWSFAISSKNMIYNNQKQWGKMEVPNPPAATDYVVGSKKEFNYPININLTVRKELNKRWAIEGGLSYTYLRSKETIINSLSPSIETDIKIHNIGISLNLEYMLYRSDKINIYSKYGGTIEKTKESDNKIKGWQTSVWLSGGISYRLGRKTDIFIEPGGTYYFDNNTALPTLRNEKSLNFDVTIGLRLYPFSH